MLALKHSSYGDALSVLELSKLEPPSIQAGQLRLKVLYSPINPADINMCEGKYSTQPPLPSVLGNEGVAQVLELGADVKGFSVGDRVIIPLQSTDNWFGFWQQSMLVPAKACLKVPHFIDSEQAALLTVNPLTAYLMLTQFASLKPGDPVIQNLGSSAVGRWVIYFAKRLGLSVTSIIRNEAYKDELLHLGSDSVFLDSERFSQTVAHKGDFKLALNGVGGASAKELCKCLAKDALLLSYGAMSKEPISIGTGLLIFKNLTLKGFNRSLYLINKSVNEINVFYKLIFDFLDQNSFAIPIDSVYELADYKQAFCRLSSSERKGKVLLKLN